MTINSLQLNTSTPFTGLGTQTFNVTTTGLYTLGLNITIPWMTSDQAVARTNPQAFEVQTITAIADVAGSLNSTYWTFFTAGNNNGYYVWYNINSAGVDPAVAGKTGIAVAGATGATASTLGGATRTAIAAAVSSSLVAVTGATTATILTNTQYGNCTAAADGAAPTGFTFAVGTTGTYGYASGLTVLVKQNTTTVMTLNQPSPTQPLMAGSVRIQATAADTITVVTSSLAAVDNLPNAVKGIVNLYAGE